jgi:hypothetical protein
MNEMIGYNLTTDSFIEVYGEHSQIFTPIVNRGDIDTIENRFGIMCISASAAYPDWLNVGTYYWLKDYGDYDDKTYWGA